MIVFMHRQKASAPIGGKPTLSCSDLQLLELIAAYDQDSPFTRTKCSSPMPAHLHAVQH